MKKSELDKAVEKIKKGIKCPNVGEICNKPILPENTIGSLCKDNPELAFYTGWEMAILECGELLAKAQSDKEKSKIDNHIHTYEKPYPGALELVCRCGATKSMREVRRERLTEH